MVQHTCSNLRDAFGFYMPGDPPPEGVVWEWSGAVDRDGYGQFGFRRRMHRANRVSYTLFVGPIPDGLVVRHKNDRPIDVNPHNLELGTHADNMRDKVERGRQARGGSHGMAKLTPGEVLAIRAAYEAGGVTQKELARRYGLAKIHVGRIVRRESWAHI